MVERQIAARGISDRRLLDAILRVPRHVFIGENNRFRAYDDMALPTNDGQTISQPYIVARMTELLSLSGKEKVLEVGTGSGYQTALLAELAREVFSIERRRGLLEKAEANLNSLGYGNLHFKLGDGTLGWPDEGPFDRVLITAATPEIPEPLKEQLSDGGIIVAPVGNSLTQNLVRAVKLRGELKEELHEPCVFVPLVGEHGWRE